MTLTKPVLAHLGGQANFQWWNSHFWVNRTLPWVAAAPCSVPHNIRQSHITLTWCNVIFLYRLIISYVSDTSWVTRESMLKHGSRNRRRPNMTRGSSSSNNKNKIRRLHYPLCATLMITLSARADSPSASGWRSPLLCRWPTPAPPSLLITMERTLGLCAPTARAMGFFTSTLYSFAVVTDSCARMRNARIMKDMILRRGNNSWSIFCLPGRRLICWGGL